MPAHADPTPAPARLRARHAFTLIELLVVVAIVAIIAGLIIALAPGLKDRAKVLDTGHRMQAVLAAIQAANAAYGDGGVRVQREALGVELRWAPLREVLATLVDVHKVDLDTQFGKMPYRTAHHSDPTLIANTRNQTIAQVRGLPEPTIEKQVGFLIRARFWQHKDGDFGDLDDGAADVNRRRPVYGVRARKGDLFDGYFADGRATPNPLGEHIDRTREALPDGPWTPEQYLAAWPAVSETIDKDKTTYDVRAWPASDWDARTPGAVPPIWEWPWGERIVSRTSGEVVEFRQERDLSQLSPLGTLALMQFAGIVPPGEEGAKAWRSDRNVQRPWNDRWGNPLVVVAAAFLAPRYDYLDGETYRDLKGGRDFLLQRALDTYGYARATYLAVGAVGPKRVDRDDDLDLAGFDSTAPLPAWEADADATVVRLLWMQVRAVCRASDWDRDGFAKPPWTGVRDQRQGGARCLLTAPQAVTR